MKGHLFIIIVLLSAATLLLFASCDNAATQVDKITLDASPGDFDAGDVDGTIPANEEQTMIALGEVMMPAMEGVGMGLESEFEEITCFNWFFDWFFESFMSSGGEELKAMAIEANIDWEQIMESSCQGTITITGNETVNGDSGTASLTMPANGAIFKFSHGQPATWLRGEIDINAINMAMDDYVAEVDDPIVNALGIVFTDVDVKVDLSNLDVVEGEPSGWITITYGAFDVQTEVIIAAANSTGYGGIFWLDFKVWIPPQTVTINMDTLMSQSEGDIETIINAVAPGLSVYLSVKVYEGPTSNPKLDFQYTLDDIIGEVSD